jgi:SAM-dependent methyltransferase
MIDVKRLTSLGWRDRVAPALHANAGSGRLKELLPILRCPETGRKLALDRSGRLVTRGRSRYWPIVEGRPVLFPGLMEPRVHPADHLSNSLDEDALELMRRTDGLVLNLSAGGTEYKLPNVIEAEAAIFRNTDVIADAHSLPFADGVFAAVVAYNAFEHYEDPSAAARQIWRVLRPGGQVLIRTAFMQPLHEPPYHFFNCTKFGLLKWFAGFETLDLHVSRNFNPGNALAWMASEAERVLREGVSEEAANAFAALTIADVIGWWRKQNGEANPVWRAFSDLPQDAQETLAAGFQYLGRKPA